MIKLNLKAKKIATKSGTIRTIETKKMPKLFCDFPLNGSKEYAFPIIVNSDLIDVEINRDAIRDCNVDIKI
ncbi:hypothetical protein [Virgibacillus sp. DJP39]|uniref:hypothetical protein n=1 Tax=Virgibacillus sp. DJP39 TaxID=3409790 RepID=UPI003BB4F131